MIQFWFLICNCFLQWFNLLLQFFFLFSNTIINRTVDSRLRMFSDDSANDSYVVNHPSTFILEELKQYDSVSHNQNESLVLLVEYLSLVVHTDLSWMDGSWNMQEQISTKHQNDWQSSNIQEGENAQWDTSRQFIEMFTMKRSGGGNHTIINHH